MSNVFERPDFDQVYRAERLTENVPSLTPWDIGGPQPVVQQLVAFGGLRGEVLDPGTGPGHHAIHFASKGYSVTGIDASPAAIERAQSNAQRVGAKVDFQVADATKLDGLEDRFDTVVDSAFYHVFQGDEETQTRFAQALHRATKLGARLFMFELGRHNVNGIQWDGLEENNFRRVLPAAGWRIDHVGTTTYEATFSPETLQAMTSSMKGSKERSDSVDQMRPTMDQLQTIAPLVDNHRIHVPFWSVVATRLDRSKRPGSSSRR
ncbi:SAM-dependent methyltransferase [Mycobacterium sp. MAA66]|uniref:class I SAM-dependent methyltransferase n=1 Tax=Mycobacterium sp. MAA66 TaxID=3156297 RepID=UPI0035169BBC